ncbi:MAG TPA: hypothetical protein VF187_07005 [Gemmatimonadales bacterium]
MRLQTQIVRLLSLAGLTPLLAGPSPLYAQFGVAARASTFGLGIEASYRLNRSLGIRAGGNYLEFTRDATVQNIDYKATPHFENGLVVVDVFPMGGSFHVSGGLLLNHNEGRLLARLNQDIEIGGRTYTPSEVGSLTGTVDFRKTAPYLGLGFGGKGKLALVFDLGVGFTGTPRVNLVGDTPLTGPEKAEFDANVAQEQTQLRADIEGKSYLKFHPLLSLGLRIGF